MARPPHGTEPLSLSKYDRLLALGAEIANLGMVSDTIHYQQADVDVAMLGSGRLGLEERIMRAHGRRS